MPETNPSTPRLYPWIFGAYAAFTLAILSVLVIAGWGVYVDFEETRQGLLQAEIHRLRSHANRTVLRIQTSLAMVPHADLRTGLSEVTWLREHWQTFVPTDPSRSYVAVIDADREILMHYRPELEGSYLEEDWIKRNIAGVGDDVVETNAPHLSSGATAYDISLPIMNEQREVGSYHSGFNVQWFEALVAQRRTATRQRWLVAFAVISGIIALAGISLYHITRRLSALQSALAIGRVRRLADLGQLASGIAHEIRNPLNAIRINLHVIEQLTHTRSGPDERTDSILHETTYEIERVDGLLHSLLEYARPDKARSEKVNVAEEARAVCDLIRPIMERENVRLTIHAPDRVDAVIDRNRFRQVMLNLLKNALEAIEHDGAITAEVRLSGSDLILSVADTGGGIAPQSAGKIFDPFYTTKELGTGLGLTLVKRYVEEAGGEVEFQSAPGRGTTFTIRLPSDGAGDVTASEKQGSPNLVGI